MQGEVHVSVPEKYRYVHFAIMLGVRLMGMWVDYVVKRFKFVGMKIEEAIVYCLYPDMFVKAEGMIMLMI